MALTLQYKEEIIKLNIEEKNIKAFFYEDGILYREILNNQWTNYEKW